MDEYSEGQIRSDFQNAINKELCRPEREKTNLSLAETAENIYDSMLRKAGTEKRARECMDYCLSLFKKAVSPSVFHTRRINDPHSDLFEQYYSLMINSFEPDVIEEKSYYIRSLNETNSFTTPSPDVIIVRYFRVEGKQEYDLPGNLKMFDCLTGEITEKIVSFVSGNYMPLVDKDLKADGRSVFGIGYLKTLENFQGQKHASILLDEVLNVSKEIARERNEEFTSMVSEVENDATGFFFKYGFRWPEGVYYAQPPLIYDEKTGEKQFYEVPEHLMICHIPEIKSLDKKYIISAVRALYYYWIIMKFENYPNFSQKAKDNIAKYLWSTVFKDFTDSADAIPGESCRMIAPLNSTMLRLNTEKGIILRELTDKDLTLITDLLPQMVPPFPASDLSTVLNGFTEGNDERDKNKTVFVATDMNYSIIGLSVVCFTNTPSLPFNENTKIVAGLEYFGVRPDFAGDEQTLLTLTEEVAKMRGAEFAVKTF